MDADQDLNKLPHLATYIQDGKDRAKYPDRPSMKWKPWYSIPMADQDCPDLLFLRHIDSDFRIHWNKAGCIVADGVRGVKIHDSNHLMFYLGVMNSNFFYWQSSCARKMGRARGSPAFSLRT